MNTFAGAKPHSNFLNVADYKNNLVQLHAHQCAECACCGARFDPLWNSLVVGGVDNGVPFLGTVGMIGVHFTDAHIATGARASHAAALRLAMKVLYLTSKRLSAAPWHVFTGCVRAGFGQMLARPLFRERHRPDMSEEEATQLLHDALRVRIPCCLCHTGLGAECLPCQMRCGITNLRVLTILTLQVNRRCATTATSRPPTSSRLPRSLARA